MKIKALKAFTVRDSETGDLTSIAHGGIAEVSDTLGESLISDGLAEAYIDEFSDFKSSVDKSITRLTADMLDGVTSIGYSFSGSSLISVEIPDSVESIGAYAFQNCKSLESVTVGEGITSIGNVAFLGCSSLTSVTVRATTPPTLGGTSVFSNTPDNLVIYVPAESVEAYKAASGWSSYSSKIQAQA